MTEIPAGAEHGKQHLDVCTVCQFVWFDYGEYAALPSLPKTTTWEDTLPQEAREKIALMEVEAISKKYRGSHIEENEPDVWWQWIPAILGMPIERDTEGVRSIPWVTWLTAGLIILTSVFAFSNLPASIQKFGLIPAEVGRYGGLTLLTSFLIHGGVIHLVGNVYFLLIFGDNVEDWLGKWRFFLLLLCATLIGDLAHIWGNAHDTIPCIGASGGISGVIAFYALKFPRARLSFLIRFYWRFRWISLSAYKMFFFWVLIQFLGARNQLSGLSSVSSLAHLGGMSAGLIFWFVTKEE
ncbi:MAG: rhomboid family intramembrane serine protease [Lentisphaerae bacterium]|nr:rhomboid family intramembrane serine protease [Lentisphaerota bacterium]